MNHFETERRRKNGVTINVSVMVSPVRELGGKIVGAAVIERDITARIQTETALRFSDGRFRLALMNSPITVATLDHNLRFTWIYNSRRAFPTKQVLGKRPDELIAPADAAELMALLRHVRTRGVMERREVCGRIRGKRWVYDMTVEALRDEGGALAGSMRMAATDITPRKQMEEALRRATTSWSNGSRTGPPNWRRVKRGSARWPRRFTRGSG